MARPPHTAEELLRKDRARLRALARGLVGETEADDVLQDAWLVAAARPPPRTENHEGWLRTVTRNLALRRKRSAARRRLWEQGAARHNRLPSAGERAEALELRRKLLDAVEALEEPFRRMIIWRYLEGLPPRAIAKQEGIPLKTVKSRLSRGLERLRGRLDRVFGDRRLWLIPLGLVAFARDASAGASLTQVIKLGGGVMSAKKVVAVAILIIAGGAWLGVQALDRSSSPDEPTDVSRGELTAPPAGLRGPVVDRAAVAPSAAVSSPGDVPRTTYAGRIVDPQGRGVPDAEVRVFYYVNMLQGQPLGSIFSALRFAKDEHEQPTTRTDDAGQFRFDQHFWSEGFLRVRAAGFSTAVARAQSGEYVVIAVHPSEALRVRVSDPEGEPVRDATVRLVTSAMGGVIVADRPRRVLVETRTDAQGQADLPVVRDEQYLRVEVVPREPGLGIKVERVAKGMDEIAVRVPRVRVVERKVLDASTGRPVEGAYVDVLTSGVSGSSLALQRRRRRFFADAGGVVRFPHQEDYYAQVVTAPGYFVGDAWQEPILLQRGMRIHGTVLDARGQPLAGAAVLVAMGSEAFGRMRLGMSPAAAWSDTDGHFDVDLKLPWPSHGKPPPDLGLRSVVAVHPDHTPAISDGISIVPGAEREVTLRCLRPATLDVRLIDREGNGISRAFVSLQRSMPVASTWPAAEGPLFGLSLHTIFEPHLPRTDADGRCRIERLPPGRHFVRIENLTEEIAVEAGQTYRVEMVKGLGPAVRIHLIDADGAPVVDRQVFLVGPSQGGGRTDAEGRFRFEDVRPGDYQVTTFLWFPRALCLWRMPVIFDAETTLRVPVAPGQLRVHTDGPPPGTTVEYMLVTDNGGQAPHGGTWGPLEKDQETYVFTPGSGLLFVRAKGHGWTMTAFDAPAGSVPDVHVRLVQSGGVRGRYAGPLAKNLLVRLRRTDVRVPTASGLLQHAIDAAGVAFRYATLDEQGRFELPDVVPGVYEISVGPAKVSPWKPRASDQVTVASGETAELELAP